MAGGTEPAGVTLSVASCHCGTCAIECRGTPTKVSLCHCTDCQRRSGSIFSIASFWPREATTPGGQWNEFRRPSASGQDVKFHFCPRCGANVWWEAERLPHLIGVAVGCFADPGFRMPDQAVWDQDQHFWLDLPTQIPSYRQNPS